MSTEGCKSTFESWQLSCNQSREYNISKEFSQYGTEVRKSMKKFIN